MRTFFQTRAFGKDINNNNNFSFSSNNQQTNSFVGGVKSQDSLAAPCDSAVNNCDQKTRQPLRLKAAVRNVHTAVDDGQTRKIAL